MPGTHLTLARIADARALSSADLTNAVANAYADVMAAGLPHPVRFWNFLPGINEAVAEGQTRYMAFNAGRFAAFADRPAARVATASAVGHGGRDLVVHCLAADRPGTPIDNPRQLQPHRYSARYGRRPPCFARATRVGPLLMIGGTASIRGERSVHDDLAGQVAETLMNLDAVVRRGLPPLFNGDFTNITPVSEDLRRPWSTAQECGSSAYLRTGVVRGSMGFKTPLNGFTHVRAYHPSTVSPDDLRPLLPPDWPIEFVVANLCRPELLVEIEAVVEMPT